MSDIFKAHIFKDRIVGAREEVRLKLFGPDGNPISSDNFGDSGGSGASGSPWTSFREQSEQGPLVAGVQTLGSPLEFEVGPSGMVILHASTMVLIEDNGFEMSVILDPGDSQTVLGYNYRDAGTPGLSLGSLGQQAFEYKDDPPLCHIGVLMHLDSGTHALQFSSLADEPGGGFVKWYALAAMPLD